MPNGRKGVTTFQKLGTIMGPCLIIFGLPLLIPGIAITVVPFYDETGFPKFGGLHIFGFFILFTAVLLTISGCAFSCMRKATISPLEQVQLVSPWGTPRHGSVLQQKEELMPCTGEMS
uniref:Uncharacterized protein n=1 Tax=Octopus bimaculoides TaxID=37653 RepID=A0A0L8FU89_OCTBM